MRTSAASTSLTALTGATAYPNDPTTTSLVSLLRGALRHRHHRQRRAALRLRLSAHDRLLRLHHRQRRQRPLWLSTNSSPANLTEIAYVTSSTGYRDWSNPNNPEQTSASIYLVANTPYYIMAQEKHGTDSSDNLSVRWEIPATTGGPPARTFESPIPSNRLSPPTAAAVQDTVTPPAPANIRATVTGSNNQITLNWNAVTGLASGVAYYNIYRDGATTPYATATTTSYVDSSNMVSASGLVVRHVYQVQAVNFDGLQGAESTPVSAVPVGIATIATVQAT